MKSIFLLCSVLGAVSSYASECQADEHSLLQARRLVRKAKTTGSKDSIAMLKNMRDVAESLLDGSDTTMSPDDVNEALDAASELLAELSPVIRQQIENAQQQIDDAASAVQVCHAQSLAELRSHLRESTGQRAAAVESCHNTLDQLRTAETQQCNIAEDCLCDEARVRTTDQEPLCASITETYEVVFCEHHHVCTIFHQCHSQEAEVYQHLRVDVEAEMALTIQEYMAVEQSRCLTGLIMEAMTPPRTPISHAALIACDDVDVSALNINFPDLPSEPAACPAHTHGDPQCEFLYAWQATGTLAQLEANIQEYPLTEWTYGVQYNHGWGDVHDVVINSWNRGIRVSATPFYPQGDNAADLEFGTTVFTRDTDGQTPGQWIQNYYQDDVPVHSNGVADSVQVFRRRLPHAWEQVGTLAQLESEIDQYPLTEWTFGVQYNAGWGDVHDIVINSWNRGIRVSATPSYPQGDNAAALTFGTTVFTRDTNGQTPGEWIQNYFRRGEAIGHSNGVANGIAVFRQRLSTAWQSAGTLAQLESQVSQYPFTEWTYGVQYNHGWGDIHDVVVNSWNRGIRVSATPFYPQGDNAADLKFGTTVFTRDTDGQTPGQWIQNYYQDDVPVHSNGVADSIQVFRRRLPVAWQESGTLAQLESEIAQYPLTEWTFGVQYNAGWGDVHDIVINSWNRGIRVSVTPFYPQGDNAAALKFGTTVFTRDTNGQTPGEWIQNYYQSSDAVHSNGQSPNVRVFRHRLHG